MLRRAATLFLVCTLVCIAASPAPADDRDEFDAAFRKLREQSLKRLRPTDGALVKRNDVPEGFHDGLIPVDTPSGPTKNMIKVWARLKGSGQCVSLTNYRWSPKEAFFIEFETAIPIQVHLYNEKPNQPKEIVFPNEDDLKTPSRYICKTPGSYKIGIELSTEDDGSDEPVQMLFVAEGSPNTPTPPKRNDSKEGVLAKHKKDVESLLAKVDEEGLTYRGLAVETEKKSADPDAVAFRGVAKGDVAMLKMILRKK